MGNNKKNIIFNIFFFSFILSSCNNQNLRDSCRIDLTIKVINSETKKPLVKDVVEVREIKKPIFSMWQYIKVEEYLTDNNGEVKFKIDNNKGYRFSVFGVNNSFGSDEYGAGELKNKKKILIEVVSSDKKSIPWVK